MWCRSPRRRAIRQCGFLRMLSICTGLNEPRTSGSALRNRERAASSWRTACCPAAYPSAQTEARQAAPTASAPQAAHAKRLPCSLERWPPFGGRWNEGNRGGRHGAGSGMAATQSARSREGSVSPSRATCPAKGLLDQARKRAARRLRRNGRTRRFRERPRHRREGDPVRKASRPIRGTFRAAAGRRIRAERRFPVRIRKH